MRIVIAAAAGMLALVGATAASAQTMTLAVGRISTTQTCNYYQESAGSSRVVATRYALAVASSWRSWWVKDCATNFVTMRSTLQAALASSGTLRVASRTGRYTVSINITGVSADDTQSASGQDFSISRSFMTVNMDVSVRDSAGRTVFGGLLTKRIETGSDMSNTDFQSSSNASGEAAYGRMQNELALAAARMVAFHFSPIQVTSAQGKQVNFNYGSPLLQLGSLVMVASPDHRAMIRYRVTSASSGFAMASADGGGDFSAIVPGSVGSYIDDNDPAANGRRFEKVELP
jgi:hypothetical protein